MTAEQMRVELESFVNQGLQAGWHGWPTKGQCSGAGNAPGVRLAAPTAEMLANHARQSLFSTDRVFPRSEFSFNRDIQPRYETATSRWGQDDRFSGDYW